MSARSQLAPTKIASLKKLYTAVWSYHKKHRRDLPWRTPHHITPYHIVVSEIMLQQTQVSRVLVKYEEFIKAFPDFKSLAAAHTPDVLRLWQGLGYNRRGLALKRIADIVMRDFDGELPRDPDTLLLFPSIGPNTVGSILAFTFNTPTIFIETNIRTVFIHFLFDNSATAKSAPNKSKLISDKELLTYIEAALSYSKNHKNSREWYYALMDYGSMLKARLRTEGKHDPMKRSVTYKKQSTFRGSFRHIRATILKIYLEKPRLQKSQELQAPATIINLTKKVHSLFKKENVPITLVTKENVAKALHALQKEGLVQTVK